MLDLFNREIVGWSIKPRMTADIVTDALTMAWFRRKPDGGMIFHSDRGSQYASQAMTAKLTEYGMTAHFSDRGHPFHADRGHRFTLIADSVQRVRVPGFIVSQVSAMGVKPTVLSTLARSAGVGNSAPKAMLG